MQIHFCGADRTVTGSCHILEVNGVRVLLDFGMFQGPRAQADSFNRWIPPDALDADAVILSHAHLDHCGKLPTLLHGGYKGPIYCTDATAAVTQIVLLDAAKIQQEDADYLNQHGVHHPPIQPLYTGGDVQNVMRAVRPVKYGQKTEIRGKNGVGLSFTYFDAGHILGSAYVLIEYSENNQSKKLLFTADVGRYDTPIIRDPQEIPGPVDTVITESTYGDTLHGPMSEVEPQFLAAVKSCVELKSRLLVPSFAVGRTQTVLYFMQKFIYEKKIPPIPVYVDSPMGVAVTKVHSEFRENYDDQTNALIGKLDLFGLAHVTFTSTPQESKKINADQGPCVIIASSPTCEFGRILHHLKHSASQPNDLVVFVGWTPPQTLGSRLQNGQRHVRILDEWMDVKFRTETIHGLSAHADCDELVRFLKPTLVKNTKAYIVHGEVDQAEGLKRRLLKNGVGDAEIPALDTHVTV
jgi:metallo-beta-lactamase family protein